MNTTQRSSRSTNVPGMSPSMIMVKMVLIDPDHAVSPGPPRTLIAVSTPDAPVDPATDDPAEGVFDRLWTVPNLFTLVRLLLSAVCSCTCCSSTRTAPARPGCSAALGSTDWVDGYIARRFDQVSEFGKIFDPTVDRLLFIVSVTAIIIDGSIPLWFAVAVLVREVLVG